MTRERLLGGSPLALQLPSATQPGGDALTPCSRKVTGPEAASCSRGVRTSPAVVDCILLAQAGSCTAAASSPRVNVGVCIMGSSLRGTAIYPMMQDLLLLKLAGLSP